MKTFPIMKGRYLKAVPFAMVLQNEARAKENHGNQTVERLAERGGLSTDELAAVLLNRKWADSTHDKWKAEQLVLEYLHTWLGLERGKSISVAGDVKGSTIVSGDMNIVM